MSRVKADDNEANARAITDFVATPAPAPAPAPAEAPAAEDEIVVGYYDCCWCEQRSYYAETRQWYECQFCGGV